MITANIYQIVALIIALAFFILVVFLIPTLIQLKKTVKSVEDLSRESRKSMELINSLLEKTGGPAGELGDIVKRVKSVGTKMIDIAEFFVDNLRSPLITILSLLLGVEFGVKHLLKKDGEIGGEEDVKTQE